MFSQRAPGQPAPQSERTGTLVETDEEVEEARRMALAGLGGPPPAAHQVSVPVPPMPAPVPVPPPNSALASNAFRPTIRPPVAVLTVFDDGKQEGEVIRIRQPRFVIGRTEGDLCIAIDGRISSRHVEITLQSVGGQHRWVVTDLQSTHGLFVRVSRTALADRAEFLVGNGRYRFDAPQSGTDATVDLLPQNGDTGATRGWDERSGTPFRPPALTELIGNEIGNRLLLVKPEYWIGSDPSCAVCRADDPYCDPQHVRLFRTPKNGWSAEHQKTRNGLWLRMPQIVVDPHAQFQIGEQRFLIKVV